VISQRYYVADADYLVGLEGGDRAFLESLDAALQTPVWQLYFGRKSFVPSCPVAITVSNEPLAEALKHRVSLNKSMARKLPKRIRTVIEVPDSLDVRQDVPIDWQKRLFSSRCVHTDFLNTDLCISQN
jgi:CRISPR system Cascade subunit CasD